MEYIEAPQSIRDEVNTIFLAGGITNCPDWQQDAVEMFRNTNATILNPRRKDFPIGNPDAALEQITWEFYALRRANEILFWFPCETICPIVLYELGAWSATRKSIYVGVHPEYERKQDVEIQTMLARPEVEIVYSLGELVKQVERTSKWIHTPLNYLCG